MPKIKTDCIIIGAGLIGSAQAIALAKCGISSALIDKAKPSEVMQSSYDGRVSAISQSSIKVLSYIGVWEKLLEFANPIEKIVVTEGQKFSTIDFDSEQVGEPFGFMVPNHLIRKELLRAASENPLINLYAPNEIASFEHENHVEATLQNGELLSAELLIIADGRYSQMRSKVGINHRKFEYDQAAIVCNISHTKQHQNIATEWFFAQGPLAVLPMFGGRESCIVWSEQTAMAEHIMQLDDEDFLEELSLKLNGTMGDIALSGARYHYPLNLFQAEKYIAENAVVIGDAAHAIHPIAGQGVNLGYRDIAALTEVLVTAKNQGLQLGNATILQQYQTWRSFDAASMIATTDILNRLFSNNSQLIRALRNVGMAAFERTALFKNFFMESAMGMSGDLPKILQLEAL